MQASIFWSSGTWFLFVLPLLALLGVLVLYIYQGKKEQVANAADDTEHRDGPGTGDKG